MYSQLLAKIPDALLADPNGLLAVYAQVNLEELKNFAYYRAPPVSAAQPYYQIIRDNLKHHLRHLALNPGYRLPVIREDSRPVRDVCFDLIDAALALCSEQEGGPAEPPQPANPPPVGRGNTHEEPPQARRVRRGCASKTTTPEKRSWTQPELDKALYEYVAARSEVYHNLVRGVEEGRPGAKKDAQKLFGRNVLADALGVKSKAQVTKSPAWKEKIKPDLFPEQLAGKVRKRVGLDAAEGKMAGGGIAAREIVPQEATKRETAGKIRKLLKGNKVFAESLIESLIQGEMIAEAALHAAELTSEQCRDARSPTVHSKL